MNSFLLVFKACSIALAFCSTVELPTKYPTVEQCASVGLANYHNARAQFKAQTEQGMSEKMRVPYVMKDNDIELFYRCIYADPGQEVFNK